MRHLSRRRSSILARYVATRSRLALHQTEIHTDSDFRVCPFKRVFPPFIKRNDTNRTSQPTILDFGTCVRSSFSSSLFFRSTLSSLALTRLRIDREPIPLSSHDSLDDHLGFSRSARYRTHNFEIQENFLSEEPRKWKTPLTRAHHRSRSFRVCRPGPTL